MKKKINFNNFIRETYIPILDVEEIPMSYNESELQLNQLILQDLIDKHCGELEKKVLFLFSLQYSLREIAEILNIKFSKIKSAYMSAIQKLRRYYVPNF